MSYHLRELFKVGMVEEDEQRNGRERWWRRPQERVLIPNSIGPEVPDDERIELEAAHANIESFYIERDEQALARWHQIRYDAPVEFQDAAFIGNFKIWGTAEQLQELSKQILDLVHPLRTRPKGLHPDVREFLFTLRTLIQDP
jgi:hypothetical protein